jgi:predicted enzyme related to lactoylglutathione lyase
MIAVRPLLEEPAMPRPIHFEIHAENIDRAKAFYTKLFGWEFTQWGTEAYWLIKTGADGPGINGGMMPRRGGGPLPMAAVNAFVCTVDVTDLDAMLLKLTEAGGTVALAKMPIPTMGWLAYGTDTEGNLFGMMQMDATAA